MALVEVNLVVILFVRQVKAYVQITLWKLEAVESSFIYFNRFDKLTLTIK